VEVVQNARVLKLEGANTKLRAELEQARLKVVETEEHENSLRSSYTRQEGECEILGDAVEALKREKSKVEIAHESIVCTIARSFMIFSFTVILDF
jgi:predicted nuclease with TOPRIM domain